MRKPFIKCDSYNKARNMNSIMKKLDHDGFYTVDSIIPGLGYASNGERVRLEFARASLDMKFETLLQLVEEIQDIIEEIQFRNREGLKLNNENRVD